MGDRRTFRRKVQGGIVHSRDGEVSRAYFIKMFPERRKVIEKWSDSFANDARDSVAEHVLYSQTEMEAAYADHVTLMAEQYKKYGTAAMTAELEHVQTVDKTVNGNGNLDALYGKLVNEVCREAVLKGVFNHGGS